MKIDGFGAMFFTLFPRLCSPFWVVALQGHSVHVCDCSATGFHVPQSSPEECLQDLSKHLQFRPDLKMLCAVFAAQALFCVS